MLFNIIGAIWSSAIPEVIRNYIWIILFRERTEMRFQMNTKGALVILRNRAGYNLLRLARIKYQLRDYIHSALET